MDPAELYPESLVFGHEASAITGVPESVIRKWASRGKIARFAGSPRQYSGQGHEYKTMYALPEVKAAAAGYKPRQTAKAA